MRQVRKDEGQYQVGQVKLVMKGRKKQNEGKVKGKVS